MAFSSLASFDIIHKWVPPPTNSLKLNFDGSAHCNNPSLAGVGGIIRNNIGTPILSFSEPVGVCSANEAELLAMDWP